MNEHGTDVAILAAIKAVRAKAADERAALHATGKPLTDYDSGVLDGLDYAWIAGRKAASRPTDERTTTSIEEWWACDDAYEEGYATAAALAASRLAPIEALVKEWSRPLNGARQRANTGEDFARIRAEEAMRDVHVRQLRAAIATSRAAIAVSRPADPQEKEGSS